MIGTISTPPQRFPVLLALTAVLLAACGGGGGGGSGDAAPTLVSASFVGGSGVPAPGDSLRLLFSEPVVLGTGLSVSDEDVSLPSNATLGTVSAAPTLQGTNSVVVTLGAGVSLVPGTTTIALVSTQDAVRDASGQLAVPSTPIVITAGDGTAPSITNVTTMERS